MTRWNRGIWVLLLGALTGTSAMADMVPATDAQACWGRAYSATHLADNPGQRVAEMRLILATAPDDHVSFQVQAVTTDDPNRIWLTEGGCHRETGADRLTCYVWCDGGGFALEQEAGGDSLLLINDSFVLSSCGADALAADAPFLRLEPDPDHQVFRLYRLRAQMCGG